MSEDFYYKNIYYIVRVKLIKVYTMNLYFCYFNKVILFNQVLHFFIQQTYKKMST